MGQGKGARGKNRIAEQERETTRAQRNGRGEIPCPLRIKRIVLASRPHAD